MINLPCNLYSLFQTISKFHQNMGSKLDIEAKFAWISKPVLSKTIPSFQAGFFLKAYTKYYGQLVTLPASTWCYISLDTMSPLSHVPAVSMTSCLLSGSSSATSIYSKRGESKFFSIRADPIYHGCKTIFERVASPASVSIALKYIKQISSEMYFCVVNI